MKTLNRIGVLAAFVLLASNLKAQIILTPTTLSAALSTSGGQFLTVTSATPNVSTLDNFAAPGASVVGTGIIIENEYMTVKAVSGTTITVSRGQGGTRAVSHPNAALVWSARPQYLGVKVQDPQGSCTRSTEQVVPYINAQSGNVSDCLGGRWVTGRLLESPPFRVPAPDPGGVLYTGINTSGTAVGATTLYCTEMNLKGNKLLTGLSILNGTTVTGNARYVILYDSTGNALVNSALAGQASVTASVYENYPFVNTASTPVAGKFFAVGPAQYFACLQDNAVGSTTVRMAVTGQADQVLSKGQTAAVFGTVPALTVPTTFTTAVGPFMSAY